MLADALKKIAELNAEVETLQERLLEREERLSQAENHLKASELRREYLAFQVAKLQRMLFGKRSEKLPPRSDGTVQLELFAEAGQEITAEEEEEVEEISYERKKRRAKRKPIPDHLERKPVFVDVDPELRICPDCGEPMSHIGCARSEELEYVPAVLHVIEYLLAKYACKKCQNGVVQAPVPPRPIPKARPGAGLLAYLLVSKYEDHLPLNRLERIFARHGLEISRKTLCDWVQAMAELLGPIVLAMKRELLEAPLLQADETPIRVRDPDVEGKTARCWIWTWGIPDGEVVYDFSRSRSAASALAFLGEYSDYLQSDCYSVYTSLASREKIVHVGCWAHARRRFFDARAEQPGFSELVVSAIQKLFRIESRAKRLGIVGEKLVELRKQESVPVLDRIKALLEAKRPDVLPESGTGDAIDYTLDNWASLARYVETANAEISNNGAERALRRVVLGRKNWLWVGHPNAGPRAATLFSLIESCRRLGIAPYDYLQSVIGQLAVDPSRACELTPRRWREQRERALAEAAAEAAAASENTSPTTTG